ncbi:hypothetical protein FF124_17465 [Martelella lutilitoris]|uniref:Uncharacterized protein n=1 Tax=Martelella lutilitoris TaxID=2583532 RepID=A0A5C4JMU5_9HYPH|nr:hypothetical protein [Martelella lutilitoris]TNB46765.1 hypothetical protein FF124_17465 [Martelella lutilitoris]
MISPMLVRNKVIEKNAATSRKSSVIFASISLYVFIMFRFCSFCKPLMHFFTSSPGAAAVQGNADGGKAPRSRRRRRRRENRSRSHDDLRHDIARV